MYNLSSFKRYCPGCNIYGFVTRTNACSGCGELWHQDGALLRKQKNEERVEQVLDRVLGTSREANRQSKETGKDYTTSKPSAPKGWEKKENT